MFNIKRRTKVLLFLWSKLMIHRFVKTQSKLSTIAIVFNVGSRDERKFGYNDGMAHMLEHCIFKGTKNRTAFEIQNEIAILGGSSNAFTSHEKTGYYISVPYENTEKAVEILSDMIFSSTIPEEEFLKEKSSL